MRANIKLISKSGHYKLVTENWQKTFYLEQISLLKMHKKYNYQSIFMYLLLLIFFFLVLSQIFTTNIIFFLFLIIYTLFWFIEFIYTPIYEIELSIDSELICFSTKNKDIYQDFLLLKHFYRNEELH